MIKPIIAGLGFFLLAGTAGSSDLNPFMSLTQITIQSIIGLGMFIYGLSDHILSENKFKN